MDVQTRQLDAPDAAAFRWWTVALLIVVVLAVVLRLKGIHDPILDHPAWRQGDTAGIARNFARLQYDIMRPQTTYNGPPPNYVELELQIVPFLAATLYKIVGIHEIFGRLITLAFSVATVAVVAFFGRWLFASDVAGIAAAFFYAVFPGSVYYGRTFTPDTAMAFFLTAAVYAAARLLIEDPAGTSGNAAPRPLARATALLTLAYLAKPVAVIGLFPVLAAAFERLRSGLNLRVTALAVLVLVPLIVLWLYDRRVASYAEWHWASGITTLHVLPALRDAFSSLAGFGAKLEQFRFVLGMFRETMIGTAGFVLAVMGFVALPWTNARSKALLWCWLGAGLAYVFVVVTVERVDYYMYPLLPVCALVIGGAIAAFLTYVGTTGLAPAARAAVLAVVGIVAMLALFSGRSAVAAYYGYPKAAYRNAVALSRTLDPNALIVIGHYGPDVQYYIDRFGWEEDPALWTPFDEESAIRKGARYFISIEDNRLRRNVELCAWLSRFPVLPSTGWVVYQTDPAKAERNAESFWRAFRRAESQGKARQFLDSRGVCSIKAQSR